MSDIEERAKREAESPENVAKRDQNERIGVDNDRAAQNPETNPTSTDHPAGESQASENAENEPPA
jgi:hypothetical protein